MADMTEWIWYLVAIIAAALPVAFIKKYNDSGNKIYLLAAIILYIVLITAYIRILKTHEMATIYPFLKILSIIIVVFTGVIWFGDQLHPKDIIGIILGLVALYLLWK